MQIKLPLSLLAASALLIHTSSSAQGSYRSGYVIHHSGDTVHGLIRYKRWDESPRRVIFKRDGKEITYRPAGIAGFFIEDEHYQSAVVNIDQSEHDLQFLEKDPEPRFSLDTVFLQQVFRGSVNLYYHKDKSGKTHFFTENGATHLEPLIYKKYIITAFVLSIERRYVKENEKYKEQLKKLLGNCEEILSQVDATTYTLNSLIQLFAKHTACVSGAVTYIEDTKKFRTHIQALIGVNYATVNFRTGHSSFQLFEETDFSSSVSPDIGLGFTVHSLRGNLSMSLHALYSMLNLKGEHLYYRDEDINTFTKFALRYHSVKSFVGIGIRPVNTAPSLYVNISGSVGALIEQEDQRYERTRFYSQLTEQDRGFESKKTEVGYGVSLGYQFKKGSLELMYERTDGISGYSALSSNLARLHLFFKYNLTNKESK